MTEGFTVRPFAFAFFASRPAASMTLGLEVFVQLVIAAMSTEPSVMVSLTSALLFTTTSAGLKDSALPKPPAFTSAPRRSRNFVFKAGTSMRSCGRFGPDTQGTTPLRSISISVVNSMLPFSVGMPHMPCAL